MDPSERTLEASEAAIAREREAAIARIRAGLAEPGEDDCVDCDGPIGAARKAAMPSAERCIACQTIHERTQRGPRYA